MKAQDNNQDDLTNDLGQQKVKLYEIKHFIFDFGGVMVEKTFVLQNLFDIIEADLKIRIPSKENSPYVKKLRRQAVSGIISTQDFIEKLLERYYYPNLKQTQSSLPLKKVNVHYYLELWFNLYSQLTELSSEMELIIERLHKAGYIVSLMSNTYDIHAKSNELRGFYDIFFIFFLSNEIGLIKPDLDKYKHVLQKLDTKPKKCVFIDDKLRNLMPAKKLGFTVIRFESMEDFKQQLSELGIENISKDFRQEVKKKYKQYKMKKNEYKKAKKAYKKAKKDYLKKKNKSLKRRELYDNTRVQYEKKRNEYKIEKQNKKELITKF